MGFATAPTAEWLVLVDRSAPAAFWQARLTLAFQLGVIALGTAIAVVLLLWSGRRLDNAAEAERRTLAQLEEAVGRLEHRQALHDAFVGVMSHELRTPVTTIYGAIKLLVKSPRRPDLESLLGDIEEEADRLQRITEDLLVLSRAEHGLVEVRPEPVLLQRIATSVVADVARRFGSASIAVEIPHDLPPLSADPGALRQVLDNLLANAAKYGDGTPIRLTADGAGRRRGGPDSRSPTRGPGCRPASTTGSSTCSTGRPRTSDAPRAPGSACSWSASWSTRWAGPWSPSPSNPRDCGSSCGCRSIRRMPRSPCRRPRAGFEVAPAG